MLKKYAYFTFLVIVLFGATIQPALALEVNYPNLVPFVTPWENITLPQYIQYIFVFIIILVGAIGIISIAISGFQILLSFGSPAKRGAAMERIRSIILGIILLVSSTIILRTINIELVTPISNLAPLTPGIYLRKEVGVSPNNPDRYYYTPAQDSMNDISLQSPGQLYYYCGSESGANLLVWLYQQKHMIPSENGGHETTFEVKCNQYLTIDPIWKSYNFFYEDPGVYFYKTDDCSGYSSQVQKGSGDIEFPYAPNIGSVRIVNGIDRNKRYGVILSKSGGFKGECSDPIIRGVTDPSSGSDCFKIPKDLDKHPFEPYFAYIIKYNPDYVAYGTKGEVRLYSENLYASLKQKGSQNPKYDINKLFLYNPDPNNGNPDNIIRDQKRRISDHPDYAPRQNECCTEDSPDPKCKNENGKILLDLEDPDDICLEDIWINEGSGGYYVFLYAKNNKGDRACQDFSDIGEDELNTTNLLKYKKKIYKIVVIPR